MDLVTRLKIPEHVLFRNLDGQESVLLNLATGTYFSLNAVGTRVWELLQSNHQLLSISLQLEREFTEDLAVIQQDLCDLVGELLQRGLVETADPGKD